MDEPRLKIVGGTEAPGESGGDRPLPELEIVSARAVERSAVPTLTFTTRIVDPSGIEVYTVALTALFTIEPGKRSYDEDSRERLAELFGAPERWAATTGAFRWAQVDVLVPSFTGETELEIQVPCTYDHEIAATKYFGGLGDGAIPLQVHFNGTLFYRSADGRLQMMMLPWDLSVRYELPVATWRGMIDRHYPEGSWVRVRHSTLDRLRRQKLGAGLATYDATVEALLDREEAADDA